MPELPPVKRFVSNTGARVYRIACAALPNLSSRVYLILNAGPPTLVDASMGRAQAIRQVLDGIETVRRDFNEPVRLADIRRILITHAHLDHFGGLSQLARRTKADVGVHALDQRLIAAFDERAKVANRASTAFLHQAGVEPERVPQVINAFVYSGAGVPSVPVDLTLSDGQELDGLRIVHTPGHSPGHVCIAIGDVLLAGDHLLAWTVPQQWPESTAAYTGLGHYFESLEKIGRLPGIAVALGGHEPAIRDVPKRIEEIRRTCQSRLDRVLDVLSRSPDPLCVSRITDELYERPQGFQAMLVLADVGARVEYLDQRGLLAIANLDEVAAAPDTAYRYRPA